MITIKHKAEIHEFETLDQAMAWAKVIGEFVAIQSGELEIVGKFGVDAVTNGKLPNGQNYSWKKRRKS